MITARTLLFCLLLASSSIFAQKNVDVMERNAPMSLGARNGFSVTFEGMSKKDLKDRFDEFVEQYGKKVTLTEVTKTEYLVNDVTVKTISETPIDIYLVFDETKSGTTVTGFFDMGTQFMSSALQPVKYKDAENFMRRFAWRIEKIRIQDELVEANKLLQKRNDEQKALEKENASLNKDISDCNASIDKAKSQLSENEKNQDAKKKEITDQKKNTDAISTELDQYVNY